MGNTGKVLSKILKLKCNKFELKLESTSKIKCEKSRIKYKFETKSGKLSYTRTTFFKSIYSNYVQIKIKFTFFILIIKGILTYSFEI